MKNLEEFGVEELKSNEINNIEGGSFMIAVAIYALYLASIGI